MTGILLTQSNTLILGPVAKLLGWIMNAIYMFLDNFGIQNIGLCIILFTVVINICMLPLTIKQQKFSKLQAKMNPELQAIRKKYQGKNDQDSMQKLNAETKLVYEKYGSSPTGSCLPLIVQMPILFALYRVIYNIPAYVSSVKDMFLPLAESLSSTDKINDFAAFVTEAKLRTADIDTTASLVTQQNSIIDALYKLSTTQWEALKDNFTGLSSLIETTHTNISHLNNFLGIDIANSPSSMFTSAFSNKNYIMLFVALIIPLLSALTQIINVKLMPQAMASDDNSVMASSMKSLNMTMPIMSAFFAFTVPAGLGIYWITGAVVRSIQQVLINRNLSHVSIDELVSKNQEKMNKKNERKGLTTQNISNNAKINTKNINENSTKSPSKKDNTDSVKKSTEYNNKSTKPGSLASKANMVKKYNEKN